ncbi:MAM and LDL-receptor class A domain-containing protein 1-like [Sycon ciliatum]|uniref:MAM and LDL-receptor class A domain-containing protein 1-like n=1 Tax=Sycon ciliatum TaxID=27933 RepID=UPI0031F60A7D
MESFRTSCLTVQYTPSIGTAAVFIVLLLNSALANAADGAPVVLPARPPSPAEQPPSSGTGQALPAPVPSLNLPPPNLGLPPPPSLPRHPSCDSRIDFSSHFHGFAQTHGGHDHRNWYLSSLYRPMVPAGGSDPYTYARFRKPYAAGDAALLVSPLYNSQVFGTPGLDSVLGTCYLEFDYFTRGALIRASVHSGRVKDSFEGLFDRQHVAWASDNSVDSVNSPPSVQLGNNWKRASISLNERPLDQPFMVAFEGVCGPGVCTPFGIAAISSVQLNSGCCLREAFETSGCSSSVATFDEGLDGFVQCNIDMLDWTRHYGPVLSIQTGPRADHTSGKGAYMYVESNYRTIKAKGDTAVMTSPPWTLTTVTPQCSLTFWYMMNGPKMGSLEVYVKAVVGGSTGDSDVMVFNETGDKGNQWYRAIIDLSEHKGSTITVSFHGVLEASLTSDIAIDDVQLSKDCCARADDAPTAVAAQPITAAGVAAPDSPTVQSPTTESEKKKKRLSRTALIIGIALPIAIILLIVIIYIIVKAILAYRASKQHGEPQHYRQEDDVSNVAPDDIATNTATDMDEATM